ncbi:hypothetical protein AAY473_003070 [Plecturocebus cupreus]
MQRAAQGFGGVGGGGDWLCEVWFLDLAICAPKLRLPKHLEPYCLIFNTHNHLESMQLEVIILSELMQKQKTRPDVVADVCNPSTLGGQDSVTEVQGSKQFHQGLMTIKYFQSPKDHTSPEDIIRTS